MKKETETENEKNVDLFSVCLGVLDLDRSLSPVLPTRQVTSLVCPRSTRILGVIAHLLRDRTA